MRQIIVEIYYLITSHYSLNIWITSGDLVSRSAQTRYHTHYVRPSGSVLDPYSSNPDPDPTKNLNPDLDPERP